MISPRRERPGPRSGRSAAVDGRAHPGRRGRGSGWWWGAPGRAPRTRPVAVGRRRAGTNSSRSEKQRSASRPHVADQALEVRDRRADARARRARRASSATTPRHGVPSPRGGSATDDAVAESPDAARRAEQAGQVGDVVVEVRARSPPARAAPASSARCSASRVGHHLVVEEALADLAQHPGDRSVAGRPASSARQRGGQRSAVVLAQAPGRPRRAAVEQVGGQHLVEHDGAEVVARARRARSTKNSASRAGRRLERGHDDEGRALVLRACGSRPRPARRSRRTSSGTG